MVHGDVGPGAHGADGSDDETEAGGERRGRKNHQSVADDDDASRRRAFAALFEKLDVKNAKELKVEDIKRLLPRIDVGYEFMLEDDIL